MDSNSALMCQHQTVAIIASATPITGMSTGWRLHGVVLAAWMQTPALISHARTTHLGAQTYLHLIISTMLPVAHVGPVSKGILAMDLCVKKIYQRTATMARTAMILMAFA